MWFWRKVKWAYIFIDNYYGEYFLSDRVVISKGINIRIAVNL